MTTSPPITDLAARRPSAGRRGFTLVELIVVMTIIGIIVSFVLVAARDATRQADMRATQALILKLEAGLNDRLDALMQLRPEPNFCHGYLAASYPFGNDPDDGQVLALPRTTLKTGFPDTRIKTTGRAQAFALADFMKSEVPDVFIVQSRITGASGDADYPLNFAAAPYPGDPTSLPYPSLQAKGNYILPLGHLVQGPRGKAGVVPWTPGYGDSNTTTGFFYSSAPELGMAGRGIYGASYSVAAGLYKNLGYLPAGYDMADNDEDGLIDEWDEGVNASNQVTVLTRLANHTHETARAEALYAVLVEGQGLLGSIFQPDDFSDREVRDTDGDGLPEFVDAWGKPLQFYRWPTYYRSDTQRGQRIGPAPYYSDGVNRFLRPYDSVFETREVNPIDPNNTLMSQAWWLDAANGNYPLFPAKGGATRGSGGVAAYESFFHPLTEIVHSYAGDTTTAGMYWERVRASGVQYRRAYFTKPLILSGGPDQRLGVVQYARPSTAELISVENNAPQFRPSEVLTGQGFIPAELEIPRPAASDLDLPESAGTFYLQDHGQDDITNHTINATAGSGG